MANGVLVDLTKCVGCGSCTVACKLYNHLPFKSPVDRKHYLTHSEDAKTNGFTWTVVRHQKTKVEGHAAWRYVKDQCMHCQEPACVSSCFSKALTKNPDTGAVNYNPDLCVGCRYCMLACPFSVPKYEWHKVLPSVSKCNFCAEKIEKGGHPACASACPTGCLTYGNRDELLAEAKKRVRESGKYVNHIYGEEEAGGTSWIYISDVDFNNLGFNTKVPKRSIPKYVHGFTKYIPFFFLGGTLLWTGSYLYNKRREAVELSEKGESKDEQ